MDKKAAKDLKEGKKDEMGDEFLGPKYNYYDYIKKPPEMGMSEAGTYKALSNDIAGIINYSNVLISGRGNAISNDAPSSGLGSRFFINTGAQCKHAVYNGKKKIPGTDEEMDDFKEINPGMNIKSRSLYIDNTVKGNILGKSNVGLVPGMIENVTHLNPMDLMAAFVQPAIPLCKVVKRPTVPNKGNLIRYVAFNDLPRDEWKKNELSSDELKKLQEREKAEKEAQQKAEAEKENFKGYENLINELKNRKRKNTPILQFIKNKNILEKYPLINVLTSGVSVALLILIYKLMNNTIGKK